MFEANVKRGSSLSRPPPPPRLCPPRPCATSPTRPWRPARGSGELLPMRKPCLTSWSHPHLWLSKYIFWIYVRRFYYCCLQESWEGAWIYGWGKRRSVCDGRKCEEKWKSLVILDDLNFHINSFLIHCNNNNRFTFMFTSLALPGALGVVMSDKLCPSV